MKEQLFIFITLSLIAVSHQWCWSFWGPCHERKYGKKDPSSLPSPLPCKYSTFDQNSDGVVTLEEFNTVTQGFPAYKIRTESGPHGRPIITEEEFGNNKERLEQMNIVSNCS
ncbi:uncharacterized protein LOC125652486 [Ostrea edulis]|uniref:uncharacterized protein LOC125652486 n=1 Tax=Ostrea edulis TaxID=37623 RepID=UPI002095B3EB|nr:uncharacterized protein LOC125652486 [Ostrea edulis]